MSSLSPNSLSSKSEGYGSISRDESDEFDEAAALMPPTSAAADEKFGVAKGAGVCSSLGNRTRNLILGALLGTLVVMIGGGAIFPSNNNSPKAGIRANHYDYGTSSSILSSSSASSSSTFETKPSFQISPIDDMGMLSVQRNDDALPSSVWGNHLDQEGHPLPTNSWYLVSCATLRYVPFRYLPFTIGF